MEREANHERGKNQELVLEGGANERNVYGRYSGCFDGRKNYRWNGVIGVSAGSCIWLVTNKSGQIGRTLRYNMKFCGDKRYGTLTFTFKKSGDIYDVDLCYHQIPEILDPFDNEAFAKNPAEFFVVCTDVETGKAVYHKCTDCGRDDLKWMQASASMPLVSKVVEIDGYKLLDGGVADSIPIVWFRITDIKGYFIQALYLFDETVAPRVYAEIRGRNDGSPVFCIWTTTTRRWTSVEEVRRSLLTDTGRAKDQQIFQRSRRTGEAV